MIYLDHAATSFHKPPEVAEAVYRAIQFTGSSGRGTHGVSLDASRLVHKTRKIISQLFHPGDPSGVVFTANATDSLNMAIQGLLKPGDHCITSIMEHNSVLRPLYLMEKRGVTLTVLPADEKGRISTAQVQAAIQPNTKAIVLAHGSNVTGNVTDVDDIGRLCRTHGVLYILDASQSAGLIPIDMERSGVSALCCSGHKGLLGPQGIGLLCLAEGVRPEPIKAGGTGVDSFSRIMPEHLPAALEAGTLNSHGIAGLLAACDYLVEYGQSKILGEANALAYRFLQGIRDLPGITVYGDFDASVRLPIISLNLRNIGSGEVADELSQRFDIAVRAGAHCAPGVHQAFGTENQGMVRFSFSHFNTEHEVDAGIQAVKTLEGESE